MKTITIDGKDYSISEERLTSLKEELTPKGRFVPRHGDIYYFLGSYGTVSLIPWCDGDSTDLFRLSQGNVFRTKAEAEKHLTYLKALAVLKEDAQYFVPDWKNSDEMKWFVFYDHGIAKFSVSGDNFLHSNWLYFPTVESAEHSLKVHEKEWRIVFNLE